MIRSFRSKPLLQFWKTGEARRLPVPNAARLGRMLRVLDAAGDPKDLDLPGFHLHRLQGVTRWSLRVTGNWRITFGWDGTDAIEIDLEDYH